jgi:hypothetical protein
MIWKYLNKNFTKYSGAKKIVAAALAVLVFGAASQSFAQMSGTNYKIPVDSVNVGGQQGGSTSYNLLDTAGELGSGDSASSSYAINAGFIGAQAVYLAISSASDVSMNPSISGISGGTGTGSTVWTVTTDNAAGYQLTIRADTTPALRSATSQFEDYTPAGADPDYNWSIAANTSEYGFTPEGSDIVQRFKDNGSACNTGSGNTADRCWDKLTTSDVLIAERSTGNHPSGTTTTVKMQAEAGNNHIQPSGTYEATIIVTALPL